MSNYGCIFDVTACMEKKKKSTSSGPMTDEMMEMFTHLSQTCCCSWKTDADCEIWSTDVLLCSQKSHRLCVWYLACKNGKYYYWNKCLVVVILQSDAENLGYLVFSQKLCCSHVGQASWNSSTSTGWVSLAFPTDTNVLKQQSLMALINRLIFWGWHTHVLVLIAVKIDADVPVPLKIVQFWFGNRSNFLFVL